MPVFLSNGFRSNIPAPKISIEFYARMSFGNLLLGLKSVVQHYSAHKDKLFLLSKEIRFSNLMICQILVLNYKTLQKVMAFANV